MELPSSFTSLADKLLEFLEGSSLIVCQVFRELQLLCLKALLLYISLAFFILLLT